MPFFLPAVRAQSKRHPALDVGRRGHGVASPPGAGSFHPNSDYHRFDHEADDDTGSPTTGIPVPTTTDTDVLESTIGDTFTPSIVGVVSSSTVPLIVPVGLSLSGPEPSSVLPTDVGSSDTIPLLSSSPPPTPTPTPTTTPETSSPVPQSSVSGSTTVPMMSEVASPDTVLSGGARGSSHLSGGVIAAIVIVLLLALGAVTFFVLRRLRIQKRVARRATWTTNLSPHANFESSLEKGFPDASIETASQSSKEGGNGQGKSPGLVRNITRKKPPLPYPVSPTAPPQSRANSPDAGAPSVRSASVSMAAPAPTHDRPVLVRMTFVPQLPDELAITPGETLYIQMEFDDGWAMCANTNGKEGMVPLECVEGDGGQFTGLSHLRTVRRASSLSSPVSLA